MFPIASLVKLLGLAVDSAEVQAFADSSHLRLHSDPDSDEGENSRSYLSSNANGFDFNAENGRVNTLFIYVQGDDEYRPFRGELFAGLSAASTRADVRAVWGVPSKTGDAVTITGLGRLGPWDRYDAPDICRHFQYSEPDDRIKLITIMMSDSAP